MAGDAGCERIHKEKKTQSKDFYSLSKRGRGLVWRKTPVLRGGGFKLSLSDRGGCRAECFSWSCTGCGLFQCCLWVQGLVLAVWHVLFRKFQEPWCRQGTSSNFLVLRIEAPKIGFSRAILGPASPGKESLKGGFCPINFIYQNSPPQEEIAGQMMRP